MAQPERDPIELDASLRPQRDAGNARTAFILALSDTLRAKPDADAIALSAVNLVAKELGLDRCFVAQVAADETTALVGSQFRRSDLDFVTERISLSDFPRCFARIKQRTVVVENIADDPLLSDLDRATLGKLNVAAMVATAVRKGAGVPVWALIASVESPRNWQQGEIAVLEEATERIWAAMERARAEAALRESESKYHALVETIDTGYCVIEVLFGAAGKPLDYRFLEANPAFVDQTGLADAIGKTAKALIPGHEEFWFETYGRIARTGRPERFEHRADALGRWYDVYALRVGAPEQHQVAVLFDDIKQRKEAEALLRENEARAHLLLAELQHRVRNILFVVRSVFTRTVETGGSVEDMADHFRGRLDALARTQVVVTQNPRGTADLENLVRDELLSVGMSDGPNISLDGPEVELSGEAAESFGLAIHELTTNSIKYGALRYPESRLAIQWSLDLDYGGVPHLVFSWEEQGVPAIPVPPGREGFGTELITRALPYRLEAETRFELRPGGVHCVIDLPLPVTAPTRGAHIDGK